MENRKIRVRFAPSPTGPLHIGGVRTALYNYLFARHHGGTFILRIEDTDQGRFVKSAEEYILESLNWLGIRPDEGPGIGGPHEPYRQSERKMVYGKYVQYLIESGKAYYAFDTPEELEKLREKLRLENIPNQQYNAETRGMMKNSLTLDATEVKRLIRSGVPYVVRLKTENNEEIVFYDQIRGQVTVNSGSIDDKVLMKSDGMPTYHLAHVVDDHLMEITHVIRGEEWLPSAPAHLLLYRYFGWEDTMPQFAHLPLLLKPEGTGKLSKRDGDKHGFPVFPLVWTDPHSGERTMGFREQGYLPEALSNFLALLGWNPGTEREILSLEEMSRAFSLERVSKSGAKFDINKAKFFNQHYLKQKPVAELAESLEKDLQNKNIQYQPEEVLKIVGLFHDRITFATELFEKTRYFFIRPDLYEEPVIRKRMNDKTAGALKTLVTKLQSRKGGLSGETFQELIETSAMENGIAAGQVLQLLRVLVTGSTTGADLMGTLAILGPAETASRIETAMEKFSGYEKT